MQRRDRRDDADCPVCGAKLAGNRFTGFSCQRCKAHFSAKFVARMRKQEFKSIIDAHFTPKPVQEDKVETQTFVVPSVEVHEALEEARESAKRSMQHLEDILGVSEQVPQAVDTVAQVVDPLTSEPAMPAKPRIMRVKARSVTRPPKRKVLVKRKMPVKRRTVPAKKRPSRRR